MKCNVLAICDDQIVYSDFLTKQLLRMEEDSFRICRFSTVEQLITYNREHEIQCLLISEVFESEVRERREIQARKYFGLTAEKMKARIRSEEGKSSKDIQYIYRYQSVVDIFEKIKVCLLESNDGEVLFSKSSEEVVTKLIGIYNPVHRNGQTTFARAMANYHGEMGKRVLYLNMEEYAGVVEKSDYCEGDLGEVLYYLKQDIKSINYRLASFTTKIGYYEMVPPIIMSKELRNITGDEWLAFLEEIIERSGYEIIILDLDSCVQGLVEILELCDLVYMPIREDCTGNEKRKQFELNLQRLQKEELKDKIICKNIPVVKKSSTREIEQEIVDYVRHMLA